MKNYVKNALDTLEALDFDLDHEDRKLRTDRWIFTHANEPETRLTLNFRMSEPAARTVVQKARAIVGLSSTETGEKVKRPKVTAREKAERAAERKRIETTRRLAEAREEERRAQRLANATAQRYGELDRLLRGGRNDGLVDGAAVAAKSMLTVEQVADQTGLTDKAIKRAIDSGSLEAYMCGGTVKVKGADVREWMRGAA